MLCGSSLDGVVVFVDCCVSLFVLFVAFEVYCVGVIVVLPDVVIFVEVVSVVGVVVVLAGYVVLVVDVEVLVEVVFVVGVVVVLAGYVVLVVDVEVLVEVVFVAGVVVVFVGTVVVFAVGVFVDVKSVLEIQSVSTVMAPIA